MELNVRTDKSADKLVRGDWLAPGELLDGAAEVLHALTYPGSRGDGDYVHLLVREQGAHAPIADVVSAGWLTRLATDADLAEHHDAVERARKIADIRSYADWLESNPDMPIGYGIGAQVDFHDADGIARVRTLAAKLNRPVRENLDDRTQVYFPIGSIEHRVIAWHPGGRPVEPEPARHFTFLAGDTACGLLPESDGYADLVHATSLTETTCQACIDVITTPASES